MKPGRLVVFSAPSGAGKSSLINSVMGEVPGLRYSVSATTRKPRPGEVDGIHYFFMELSPTEYQRLMRIAQSGMQSFD